jgi:hypothetical protein
MVYDIRDASYRTTTVYVYFFESTHLSLVMPLQVSLQCVLLVDAERAQGTLVILFLDKITEK